MAGYPQKRRISTRSESANWAGVIVIVSADRLDRRLAPDQKRDFRRIGDHVAAMPLAVAAVLVDEAVGRGGADPGRESGRRIGGLCSGFGLVENLLGSRHASLHYGHQAYSDSTTTARL